MIFKVCRRRQNITLFSFLFTFLVQDAIENRHKTRSFLVKMRRVMATVPKIGKELQKLDFGKLDGRKKSIFAGFWESVGNLKLAENGDRSLRSIDYRRVCDDVVHLCACLAGLGVVRALRWRRI